MATGDLREILKRFSKSPPFQPHFGWGPLNSLLLLAGIGITVGLASARGPLSE